jgi:hypothetical protein
MLNLLDRYIAAVSHNCHVCHDIIHTESVGTFKIYLHAKFHMPNSTRPLITVIKWKTKTAYRSQAVAVLFYSLPTENNNKKQNF